MQTHLSELKPVHVDDEDQFGKVLSTILSPARPLQSPEYLRGREEHLKEIRRALYADGRHVFIHGYRGVGKTSLAQTAAYQIQSSDARPIFFGCGEGTTFAEAIGEVVRLGRSEEAHVHRRIIEKKGAFALGGDTIGAAAERRVSTEMGKTPNPQSVNEAVTSIRSLIGTHSQKPVILIDEFDKITNAQEQAHFADFIKQVSDQHVRVHFIFCGIGESIDDMMRAHRSAHRYFHPIKLDRLSWEPRFEIVTKAADVLGITIDDTTIYRIAMISDGFPHYVHLLAEKLFWQVYEAHNGGKAVPSLFAVALQRTSDALEPELKIPYETATRKYTNKYEEILFAAADGHELKRRSTDIYGSYKRIMSAQSLEPLSREKFNDCINRLKKPAYASILIGNRQGWYEYREKVIRGYARLRAAQKGIELEVEHPAEAARFAYRGAPA